jgi:hypothetical protein
VNIDRLIWKCSPLSIPFTFGFILTTRRSS